MRRNIAFASLIIVGSFLSAVRIHAQSAILNLPRVSQHARNSQRIGITDVTIDYHRPLVGGRKIFGGLEAYGQVWRAGANENTIFEVSDPVTIEGQPLPKGVYGLHMIPGETSWIVIFSKNSTSWGSFTYDKAEDALRVTVKPQTGENREALTYDFEDPKPNSAVITMRWEKVAVSFKVEVNTPEIAAQSLRNQLRARAKFEWAPWMEAADFLLTNKLSAEDAVKYADQSIQVEDRFENEITKARALKVLGRKDEAVAATTKAMALGTQVQVHGYARGLQAQGQQEEAMELFRTNIKRDLNTWVAHNELARIAVAKGDFDTAVKEMTQSVAVAPDAFKGQLGALLKRVQNHDDINK